MDQKLPRCLSRRKLELGILNAVGTLFFARGTGRYLYLLRNDPKNSECWALPGGKIEPNEGLLTALERECMEEIGFWSTTAKPVPLEKFTNDQGNFTYNTFLIVIDKEFVPILNREHLGYAWIDKSHHPKPMHPGLWNTMNIAVIQQKINTTESII